MAYSTSVVTISTTVVASASTAELSDVVLDADVEVGECVAELVH